MTTESSTTDRMADLDDHEAVAIEGGVGIATIPCWAIADDEPRSLFRDLDLCWDS
jgi:hypothetical protein